MTELEEAEYGMTKIAAPKTNAMRALDQRKIPYEAHYYDDSIKTAGGVAETLGVPAAAVVKTLVMVRPSSRPMLVMVAGDKEVNLRVLARQLGAKEVQMAARAEAEHLTGLQTGGIGALALLQKPFDVYIDRDALDRDSIFVNGGRRGLNLRLKTQHLIDVTRAQPVDVGDSTI